MNKPLLALLAVALGGCSLMPDYQRPAAPVAAEWSAATGGTRQAEQTEWQDFFTDPRLQELIKLSLQNNRDMQVATARVAEARGLYGIQRADRLPTLSAQGGRSASLTPADLSTTGQVLGAQSYNANLGISAFELDFWGRVASLSDSARASYLASEEAQRAFRLSLIADVANAYFSLLEMDERTEIARATEASRAESSRLMRARREAGVAGELDHLVARGAYEFARADLASIERSRAAAFNSLVLLVGLPGPELAKKLPAGRKLGEQQLVADLAPGVPAEVLLRRPDILSAEQQLIAANANIGAARAAFLPRILLTATLGTASAQLSGLFESGQRAWSFQPTLSLPLFDFGRNAANLDVAEARKVIAVAQYEKAIQQAFKEVDDLLVARAQLVKQLDAQEHAEKTQLERLRLANSRYEIGISSYLDVLDAQRDAYSAQQSTIQVRRQLLTTAASLYKALGGGGEQVAAPEKPNAPPDAGKPQAGTKD